MDAMYKTSNQTLIVRVNIICIMCSRAGSPPGERVLRAWQPPPPRFSRGPPCYGRNRPGQDSCNKRSSAMTRAYISPINHLIKHFWQLNSLCLLRGRIREAIKHRIYPSQNRLAGKWSLYSHICIETAWLGKPGDMWCSVNGLKH